MSRRLGTELDREIEVLGPQLGAGRVLVFAAAPQLGEPFVRERIPLRERGRGRGVDRQRASGGAGVAAV